LQAQLRGKSLGYARADALKIDANRLRRGTAEKTVQSVKRIGSYLADGSSHTLVFLPDVVRLIANNAYLTGRCQGVVRGILSGAWSGGALVCLRSLGLCGISAYETDWLS